MFSTFYDYIKIFWQIIFLFDNLNYFNIKTSVSIHIIGDSDVIIRKSYLVSKVTLICTSVIILLLY